MTARLKVPKTALVVAVSIGCAAHGHAQSFFGIPLYEDGSEPSEESSSTPTPAPPAGTKVEPLPMDQWPDELTTLWTGYRSERAAGLYKVNAHYLGRLETLKANYAQAGNLEGAMSTKREIERVTEESAALEDGVDLPPLSMETRANSALTDMAWQEYDAQMAMKFRGVGILSQRLIQAIEALEVRLTMQDELQAALTCSTIVEALQREGTAMASLRGSEIAEQSSSHPGTAAPDSDRFSGQRAGDEMQNSLGMKLCWIPAGKFTMGSPDSEAMRDPEKEGQVEVQLSHGFWIGKYEVTQAEYEEVTGVNPAKFTDAGKRAPVEQVTWNEAVAFCSTLTERAQQKGELPEGWAYTLPTEAQWEYACRAGETGPFSGGEPLEVAWISANSGATTHEVGKKRPNDWGLHDVHGNVREWCLDPFQPRLSGGADPSGPSSGSQRVNRGGNWSATVQNSRCANRERHNPSYRDSRVGFRVCLAPISDHSQDQGSASSSTRTSSNEADTRTVKLSGNTNAAPIQLGSNQSSLVGLLILSLESGRYAGQGSKMTAIALPGTANRPATVAFNQPVGDSMASALEEVLKFIQLRHSGWPAGYDIEISFQEKYSPKDGPSGALACALLLDSLITGKKLDPKLAVTGDLNVDGSVQSIGGVAAKVRGSLQADCDYVGVPMDNMDAVSDLFVREGVSPFLQTQVFALSEFEEALQLADEANRSDALRTAIADYRAIQEAFSRSGAAPATLLQNDKVQERLEAVISKAPNHVSARMLLLAARNQAPSQLSIGGSLESIDQSTYTLLVALESDDSASYTRLGNAELGDGIAALRSMRRLLDERTWPYADALTEFGRLLQRLNEVSSQSEKAQREFVGEINSTAAAVNRERAKLLAIPAVVENLIN